MRFYTLESLIERNPAYHSHNRVTEGDVEMVNNLIRAIEESRNDESPVSGDVLRYTNEYGDYRPYAHIQNIGEGEVNICEMGTEPFVSIRNSTGEVFTQQSGGPWRKIKEPLTFLKKELKAFKEFGHCGMTRDGALNFLATVNVWEYVAPGVEYSTKDYSRFSVRKHQEPTAHGYRYVVSTDRTSHRAFREEEEYRAWLKTYNGIEVQGYQPNEVIVWTDKQEQYLRPLSTYLDQYYDILDTQMINGTLQQVKRVYDQGRVITYVPYQNEAIEMKGVREFENAYKK